MKNVCLITDASSGIGKEFAQLFAQDGASLLLVAQSEDRLKEICTQLHKTYGIEAIPYRADLTSSEEIQRLYEYTKTNDLQIEYLINNAGFGDMNAFMDTNWERSAL